MRKCPGRKRGDHIKCAIYCRLSKEDAVPAPGAVKPSESESIQNQRSMLLDHAGKMGWEVYGVYTDEDYSGADGDRPGFRRLIEDARMGLFNIVLCKTQSRFTRDMELVEKYIHGLFTRLGIRFIALVDHADTEVSGNKKARQINGLINEWYLEDLSENIRAVLDNKRRSGKFIGSFPVYGYRKDPDDRNQLVVDEDAARVVRTIFSLAASGYGKQRIADYLNGAGIPNPTKYKEIKGCNYVNAMAFSGSGLWNRTTVGRILRNEVYTGTMVQGKRRKLSYKSRIVSEVPRDAWIRVEGTHEGIITRELFEHIQNIREKRGRPGFTGGRRHMLSGKARCAACGRTMKKSTVMNKGQKRSYLRCCKCTRHTVSLELLEDLLISKLGGHITELFGAGWTETLVRSYQYTDPGPDPEKQIGDAEKKAAQYHRAIELLYLDRASGKADEKSFSRLYESLRRKREEADELLAELKKKSFYPDAERRVSSEPQRERLMAGLAPFLIDAVEISKRDPLTNDQEILVRWKF